MEINYATTEGGQTAYYSRGHVNRSDFLSELEKWVDPGDEALSAEVQHCWKRVCRDFEERCSIIVGAEPRSRGAFPVTWAEPPNE